MEDIFVTRLWMAGVVAAMAVFGIIALVGYFRGGIKKTTPVAASSTGVLDCGSRFSFTQLLWLCASRRGAIPHFRARLKERNLVAQIKLKDDSRGRYIEIIDGRIRSQGTDTSPA